VRQRQTPDRYCALFYQITPFFVFLFFLEMESPGITNCRCRRIDKPNFVSEEKLTKPKSAFFQNRPLKAEKKHVWFRITEFSRTPRYNRQDSKNRETSLQRFPTHGVWKMFGPG